MNKVRLGSIASLKTGPFGTQFSAKEYTETGVPVINVKNIGYGEVIENDLDYISEETKNRLSEHILMQGDIVFGRKGSVDRHAYISENYEGWVQGSDCIRVRCDDEINKKYISHYLKLNHIKKMVNNAAVGSTMASMNTDILRDIEILLPELKVQNKIERIVSLIEAKICLNRKINDNLQAQMSLIYEDMIAKANSNRVAGKFVAAKELTEVVTGKEDANFSAINGIYKFFTCSNTPLQCDEFAFDSSSILIAGNGDFNVKHYSGKFNAYQRTYVLTPSNKYYAILYLACLYQVNSFKTNSSGSIVKFITKGDVENIQVFIPDDEALLQKLNHLLQFQEQNDCQNEHLTQLRDFLLPMLMNGQATIAD